MAAATIADVLVYNASTVLVAARPRNALRTFVYAFFAFAQLTFAFAVIYMSATAPLFEKSSAPAVNLTWWEAWYFSVVTLTTFGPGDIHPALSSRAAWKPELTVVLESLTGLFFLAGAFATFIGWAGGGEGLPALAGLVTESDELAKAATDFGLLEDDHRIATGTKRGDNRSDATADAKTNRQIS